MRADEEFVKDAVMRHIATPRAVARCGGDPPDYSIEIDGRTIGLEVTRLSPVYLNEDGETANLKTVDEALCRVADDLNERLGMLIPLGCSLIVELCGPIKKFSNFKSDLACLVQKLVADGFSGRRVPSTVGEETVTFTFSRHGDSSRKKVIGIIDNKGSITNILHQASLLLVESIRAKSEALENAGYAGELWLGLLNDYWLAETDTYRQAILVMPTTHPFQKVLLVSHDGMCCELWSRSG